MYIYYISYIVYPSVCPDSEGASARDPVLRDPNLGELHELLPQKPRGGGRREW